MRKVVPAGIVILAVNRLHGSHSVVVSSRGLELNIALCRLVCKTAGPGLLVFRILKQYKFIPVGSLHGIPGKTSAPRLVFCHLHILRRIKFDGIPSGILGRLRVRDEEFRPFGHGTRPVASALGADSHGQRGVRMVSHRYGRIFQHRAVHHAGPVSVIDLNIVPCRSFYRIPREIDLSLLVGGNMQVLGRVQLNHCADLPDRTVALGDFRAPAEVLAFICMSIVVFFQCDLAHIQILVVGIIVVVIIVIPCDVHGIIISVVVADHVPRMCGTQYNRRVDARGVHHGAEGGRIACADGPLQHNGGIHRLPHAVMVRHIVVVIKDVFTQQIIGGKLLLPGCGSVRCRNPSVQFVEKLIGDLHPLFAVRRKIIDAEAQLVRTSISENP